MLWKICSHIFWPLEPPAGRRQKVNVDQEQQQKLKKKIQKQNLTMQDDHIPPICEQTRPSDVDPGWMSPESGTQSYPWSRPQTD